MDVTVRNMDIKDIGIVKRWLTNKDNHIWLDSSFHREHMDDKELAIMLLKKENKMYMFEVEGKVVGIVGLNRIDMVNRCGIFWIISGNKAYAGYGLGVKVIKIVLGICFNELGLHSVYSWAVDTNKGGRARILEKVGFRLIGRQRECHFMDNVYRDRLWYDIIKEDFFAVQP